MAVESSPVIVTGLPRSGTSLVMQMLAAGGLPLLTDGSRVPDEDNPRGYYEIESARTPAAIKDLVAAAAGKAVKITIPQVRQIPVTCAARVLFIRRRLSEVLESQRTMLNRHGRAPSAPVKVIQRLFEQQLEETDAFFAAAPGIQILPLEFHAVLARPAEAVAAIAAFLAAPLDTAAMVASVDGGLHRQRGR
jgi:hypothetical protein